LYGYGLSVGGNDHELAARTPHVVPNATGLRLPGDGAVPKLRAALRPRDEGARRARRHLAHSRVEAGATAVRESAGGDVAESAAGVGVSALQAGVAVQPVCGGQCMRPQVVLLAEKKRLALWEVRRSDTLWLMWSAAARRRFGSFGWFSRR